MTRIGTILLLALLFLTSGGPRASFASSAERRVVIVMGRDVPPYRAAESAVREKFESSETNIRTIVLGSATAIGTSDADLLIAIGTRAASVLAQKAPPETPLVYCLVGDPQRAGLIERPRTYGVSTQIPIRDQIDLIRRALPQVEKIGFIYHSDGPSAQALIRLRNAVSDGQEVVAVDVKNCKSFAAGLKQVLSEKPDILLSYPDAKVFNTNSIRALLLASVRQKVPVFGYSTAFVRAGAVLGQVVAPSSQGERAGEWALRVLGSSLNDLPKPSHERANPQIAANIGAADAMDVRLPEELIKSATQVFRKDGE